MDERRQLPRWQIKKEAKVWIPHTQVFNHCMIEDMHLKGMCVSFNKRLLYHEIVKMSFSIETNFDFIKFEAKVPWTREEGQDRHVYGLTFINIDDHDKEKMYQYIHRNCYDQFRQKWWA